MAIFLYCNIIKKQATTQNVSAAVVYNVSFDSCKFDKKYVNKGNYILFIFKGFRSKLATCFRRFVNHTDKAASRRRKLCNL